ncbi:MAG: prepilin-type N-terminal cleavage/methylation domain-containing protein [Patescibacteria group bacterium]
MKRTISGFTIVELLIVIVVIGILAAITIIAYSGLQNRSYYSAVQSDLSQVAKKLAIFKVSSSDDKYPVAVAGSLRDGLTVVDIKLSTDAYSTVANSNFTYFVNETGSDYVVMATVKNGPVLYIKGSDPTIRPYTASPYPSGMASNHATGANLTYTTLDNYAAYVGTGGGWRIWD